MPPLAEGTAPQSNPCIVQHAPTPRLQRCRRALDPVPLHTLTPPCTCRALRGRNLVHAYPTGLSDKQAASVGSTECPRSGFLHIDPWSVYRRNELLGEGRDSQVWRCTHKDTGRDFACKEIGSLRTRGMRERAHREADILHALAGHGNIVGVQEVYQDCTGGTVHIILDYFKGGDLFDLIAASDGGLDEATTQGIFLQVAHAVRHCHRNGVLHRDIKPENVFLEDRPSTRDKGHAGHAACDAEPSAQGQVSLALCGPPRAVLGDFGLSVWVPQGGQGTVKGQAGSSEYQAPEVELGLPYSYPADVWSLGVLLCCMLTSAWPSFDSGGVPHARGKQGWEDLSKEVGDLIRDMLRLNPSERPTVEDILTQPWLVQHLQQSTAQ